MTSVSRASVSVTTPLPIEANRPSVDSRISDEVDAALVGADDRARHARNQPRRAHAGIEIEMEAQFDLRRDLGVVRVAHRRQAAGAEQDGIRLVA